MAEGVPQVLYDQWGNMRSRTVDERLAQIADEVFHLHGGQEQSFSTMRVAAMLQDAVYKAHSIGVIRGRAQGYDKCKVDHGLTDGAYQDAGLAAPVGHEP
jgi:hypothetical protein